MKQFVQAALDVRRQEWPFAAAMFFYFFLVITSFWVLKPLKKGLFIEFYHGAGMQWLGLTFSAPQAELLAKMLNMGVALVAVIVFSALSHHLRRQQLTTVFALFFCAAYLVFIPWLAQGGAGSVWSFYLFGDLFSTLMVATFFTFLNDSVTSEAARRLYGLVGLGGVCGGVFGSSIVSARIEDYALSDWLLICVGLAVLIVIAAVVAGRAQQPPQPLIVEDDPEPVGRNPATEGARLVMRSRYLLSIAAIVALYEIISTILDFQFTYTVAHFLEGPAIGQHFALVFSITNWVSLLVQVLVTGLVMNRFGVGIALLILPAAIALGSSAFILMPVLWAGSLLNTADNAFSYSVNQSAKEALYVPTTAAEKYRAKAFIDMFLQRFAKALAVVVSLGITFAVQDFSSLKYLSALTLVLLVLWFVAARYAGRQFESLQDQS